MKDLNSSNTVGIMIEGNEELRMYESISVSRIHSDQELSNSEYRWTGEIHLDDLTNKDQIIVIDSWAYRARHQEKGEIIRLRNGGYNDKYTKTFRKYKIMGILRDNEFQIVVKQANNNVNDIAPLTPVRVNGVGQAHQMRHRFSSTKSTQKSA